MPKQSTKNLDYQALKAELDSILNELQRSDIDVDEALKNYKRGLQLISQLETYLQNAQNTVQELKAKFNNTAGK